MLARAVSPAGAGTSTHRIATIDRGEALTVAGVVAAALAIVVVALAIGASSSVLSVRDLTPVPGAPTAGEQDRTGPYTLEAGIDPMTALDQALPHAVDPIIAQDQLGVTVTSADCYQGMPDQAACTINYSNGMTQLQTISVSADGQTFTLPASFYPATTTYGP